MLAIGMITWWYTTGWAEFVHKMWINIGLLADRFSIVSLLKTLFAPFRQLDAAHSEHASISERFQNLIGSLISRLIGAVVRIILIIVGVILIILEFAIGIICIIVWPIIPLLPIVGVVVAISGVLI